MNCIFQTYEHILGNIFTFPSYISQEAKTFITKLLNPYPLDRGDLENTDKEGIFAHKFLQQTSKKLPLIKTLPNQGFFYASIFLQTLNLSKLKYNYKIYE